MSGGSQYSIPFTTTASQLVYFKYVQIGNKLIIADGENYPRVVERLTDTSWKSYYLDYTIPPLIEGEFKTLVFVMRHWPMLQVK